MLGGESALESPLRHVLYIVGDIVSDGNEGEEQPAEIEGAIHSKPEGLGVPGKSLLPLSACFT